MARPIPTAHYFAILDRPPVACIPAAANDDADPAAGGKLGVVVMVAVAFWIALSVCVGSVVL